MAAGRVLVAEDEAMVAMIIADALEASGLQVEVAGDGLAALKAARELGSELGVLVTDLNMPGLTGEGLIRVLWQEQPAVPVVVVTGSPPPGGDDQLRRESGGDGWLMLLHKPFDICELTRTVHRAIGARQRKP